MFGRRKIAALVAEFLGTGALTLLLLSVQRSTIGVPFFVAGATGLAITVMTFAFYRVSGAQLNPALTIALWTARKITFVRMLTFIVAQLLGAYLAYLLYTYFVKNGLQPIGGKFSGRILTAEIIGTMLLSLGYAAALYQRFTVGAAAAVAGLAYMVGSIAASPASLGLLNPAIALGVHAWVPLTYALGPIIGALIGVNLYGFLFADRELRAAVENKAVVVPVVAPVVVTAKSGRKPRSESVKIVPAKARSTNKRTANKK